MPKKYTAISSAGEGTAPMTLRYGQRFSVSIWGTWSGQVQFQRRFNGENWVIVESFTQNFEKDGVAAADQEIRIYVPTLSSGTVQAGRYSHSLMQEGSR